MTKTDLIRTPEENCWDVWVDVSGRYGFEGDGVAEGFEAGGEVLAFAVGVGGAAAFEVVVAEFLVVGVVGEDVPGNGEDGVVNSDRRSLLAASFGDLPELGGEVGVFGSAGGPAAFGDQA